MHLEELRALMKRLGVDATIIPGTDPHHSEYVSDHWKLREWLTGFDGSNGTAAVTLHDAGLWTDSRYFLQAEEQLEGSGFRLMKQDTEGVPTVEQWLKEQLSDDATVAIDGDLFSIIQANRLEVFCGEQGWLLATDFHPADHLWHDRPPRPAAPVEAYGEEYAGESVDSKVERVMKAVEKQGADAIFIASLDEIAWLYNIRGRDIERTPVAIAYAYLADGYREIFLDEDKLTPEVKAHLKANKIRVRDYDDTARFLERRSQGDTVMLDPYTVSDTMGQAMLCGKLYATSPIIAMKAVKNDTQIAGLRRAMEDDGVALTRLLKWVDDSARNGLPFNEVDIQTKAIELRAAVSDDYRDESFDLIAGYKEHGAIVHYTATPESAADISADGLLLIDTGGQYLHGTTDVTRTVTLGNVTPAERHDYTLVLKGHLALQSARFPAGTRGDQLDALARMPLWKEGLSFGHGTGHGIGHYLCCHEGPQSIRTQYNDTALVPGMATSDEPGLYRTGQYGIRIENILLTVDDRETDFGHFLRFEPLTLLPYDRRLIDTAMLTDDERRQVDEYHNMVLQRLSPRLEPDERQWLADACRPL